MASTLACSLAVLVVVSLVPCLVNPVRSSAVLTHERRHTTRSGVSERRSLPRLFYINDHGQKGCDPDNEQTLIHLLFHSDMFDWEGILADGGTNCATRQGGLAPGHNYEEVLAVLDAYASDFPALHRNHAAAKLPNAFPSPAALRALVVQGVNASSPEAGLPPVATAGSRALARAAQREDARPLWVVTGGSLSDVSRALHDAPEIAKKIRLFSIGSWNTRQDPWARKRISQVPELWWIEANTSFRGVYAGGNQTGRYNDATIVSDYIAPAGALGALYKRRSPTMKEGDMAGLYYLMGPDRGKAATNPTAPHWGGQYRLVSNSKPSYWSDLLSAPARYPEYPGAQTVSQWRTDILDLWLHRLRWLSGPGYDAYKKHSTKYPSWKTDDDDMGACTSTLEDLCPQHPPPSCRLCAGTRQHPLRIAGCTHADITKWCSVASSVRHGHPRIFFTPEIIATTRANIAAHSDLAAVYHKLKSRAMWDSVGGVSWNVQDHASMIALTYLIETDTSVKATMFTKLLAGMDALPKATTDEWTTGLTAWAMAAMYDATYNELTATQRTKYAADIVGIADRVYSYYRHGDYNNHVYIEYGPLIYPGLALARDGLQDDKAEKYLNFTSDFLANHAAKTFAQVGETDGGWPEGRSYHALFVHWFSQQLWAWKIATNINLFPNASGLRGDATWMTHTSLPHDNQPVAVADINTSPNTPKVNGWDESFYYLGILATEYRDGISQYASNASGFGQYEFRLWPYIISHDPTLAPQLPSSLPTAALFEGIGWAPMRSDWSSDATFGMFVCGRYFAGHQHHDQNQFIIHKRGTLAIDAGEYGARATECHNTIRIGGNQRMDGMPNGNDPMRFVGDAKIEPPHGQCYTGSILAYQHVPEQGWTYVAGNATNAYDISKVSEFTRQFVYLRPNLFIVYDRTATFGPEQREWMLHSLEAASLNCSQQEVTIANGNGTLWAKMLHPTDVQLTQYQMTADHDPSHGYDQKQPRSDNYIKFAPSSSPAGRQDFVTVLYAADTDSPLITSATLTSTPGAGGNWYGATVVIAGTTYEVSFAPVGGVQGTVSINGRQSILPTTIVR